MIGVYANTLDEANWFEQTQCETRYVFLDEGGARAPPFADRRTIDGAASPGR